MFVLHFAWGKLTLRPANVCILQSKLDATPLPALSKGTTCQNYELISGCFLEAISVSEFANDLVHPKLVSLEDERAVRIPWILKRVDSAYTQ